MPDVQRLDPSDSDIRSLEEARVREPSPLQHARACHRPDWPFQFFSQDGRWYVNRAKQRNIAVEAQEVGEALW